MKIIKLKRADDDSYTVGYTNTAPEFKEYFGHDTTHFTELTIEKAREPCISLLWVLREIIWDNAMLQSGANSVA